MRPIDRVTERALRNGDPEDRGTRVPLLTLEEFFDGNDTVGSIGCNLDPAPEPSAMYEALLAIRSRPDVSDVRVQITAVDAPEEEWPFSDTVWIMTSSDHETASSWLPLELRPNESWVGWITGTRYEAITVTDGHNPVAIWYD